MTAARHSTGSSATAEGLLEALERAEFALNLAVNATSDDRSWYDEAVDADEQARAALQAASESSDIDLGPECRYPGCGLPERLHGAPPGEPPNPTRSTHRFARASSPDKEPE